MNIFDIEIAYLVVVANALLIAAAALAVLRFSRHCRELLAFWRSPVGAAVAGEPGESAAIRNLLKATMRLERRLDLLQQELQALSNRPASVAPDNVRPLPIDNAARMARSGASVEELTRTCGLNIGEAKLLRQLHARRATTAGA